MRKMTLLAVVTTLVVSLPCALVAQERGEEARETLASFGKSSAYAQSIGSLFEDDFFATNMMGAVANRENYTASYAIPRQVPVGQFEAGAAEDHRVAYRGVDPVVHLDLTNDAERANQIIVSLVDSRTGRTRNHLVPLEVGASARIAAADLSGFDTLYLLAIQAFSAQVDALSERRSFDRQTLEVMVPRVDPQADKLPGKGTSMYCADVERAVDICVTGTSDCVTAWAKRAFVLASGSIQFYDLNVEFPKGTAFHVANGTGASSSNPACKMVRYFTRRTDNSKFHQWDGTDDMFFGCSSSTATCTSGCSAPGVPSNFTVTCG